MLESVFGIPIKYEVWDKKSSLPLYIAEGYDFLEAYIGGERCITIKPRDLLATLPAIKKQIGKIQQVDSVPIVLVLDRVSFQRRKSLIENNIPFITSKQVFLPFIGTMLTNECEEKIEMSKFVFSTQQLFLLYLYRNQKEFYVSAEAKILPFTAMTLTRAVKQLEATGLFTATKHGVKKLIEAKYDRMELFQKARKFLLNPVRKWGYIDKKDVTADMVLAGETALSERTMLNPAKVTTYAIWEKNFDKADLTEELIDPETQVMLELWAYDPKLFSNDNTADDLSVALSFMENNDERIEESVEELIEKDLKNG